MNKDYDNMHFCIVMYFSCCRLSQVQAVLCEGGTATPDGILCSLGMSRYLSLSSVSLYGLVGCNVLYCLLMGE